MATPEQRARKRKRRAALDIACAGLAVGRSAIVAFLYYRPLRTLLQHAHDRSTQRSAEVARLRAEQRAARSERLVALGAAAQALVRGARRLGLVKPGEQLFIVRGIDRLAPRARHTLRFGAVDDREVVARQLGPAAARLPARRRPLPVRPAGRHRAGARTTTTGEPFPTTYWLTCRAPRRRRLAARGGRRRRALERRRRRTPSSPQPRALRRRSSGDPPRARCRPSGRDGGASLELGIGGSRARGSLKCLHAHVAFALADPDTSSASGSSPSVDPLWPADCCSDSD